MESVSKFNFSTGLKISRSCVSVCGVHLEEVSEHEAAGHLDRIDL